MLIDKVSLHASGQCHWAYTAKSGLTRPGSETQTHLAKWARGELVAGKLAPAFSLIFPTDFLSAPIAPPNPLDLAIPAAEPGYCTEFFIAYSAEEAEPQGEPGLLATLTLPPVGYAHFFARYSPLPAEQVKQWLPDEGVLEHLGGASEALERVRMTRFIQPDFGDIARGLEVGGAEVEELFAKLGAAEKVTLGS